MESVVGSPGTEFVVVHGGVLVVVDLAVAEVRAPALVVALLECPIVHVPALLV